MMHQTRSDSRFALRLLMIGGGLLLLFACMFAFSKNASAHGYINDPASRAIQCKNGLNTNCGPIIYEPQSLEGPKGFPAAGPPDGKIASAGLAGFSQLDQQSATRWNKVNMTSGTNNFTWNFTARHATTSYRYFITKPDWNPNAPLTRAQFDLTPFCSVNGNGQQPPSTLTHTCNVPQRDGYHVILGVWDIADTQNAWYIVIDAQFGAGDSVAPTAPTNLAVSNVGTTTATLSWGASTDNKAVAGYEVYNGNNVIATTTANQTSANLTNLLAGTAYNLTVKAFDSSGNRSPSSNSVQFTTTQLPVDVTPPTNPTGLQLIGTPTSTSVKLKWNASTDDSGIAGYRIYNGSSVIATVTGVATEKEVTGLSPNTEYTFTVRAYDSSDNVSGDSNAVTVTTPDGPSAAPWAPNTAYTANTLVSYNGKVYKCIQNHTSLTGWEPSNVPALWQLQP